MEKEIEKYRKKERHTEEKIRKTSSDANGKTMIKDTHMQTQIYTGMTWHVIIYMD